MSSKGDLKVTPHSEVPNPSRTSVIDIGVSKNALYLPKLSLHGNMFNRIITAAMVRETCECPTTALVLVQIFTL